MKLLVVLLGLVALTVASQEKRGFFDNIKNKIKEKIIGQLDNLRVARHLNAKRDDGSHMMSERSMGYMEEPGYGPEKRDDGSHMMSEGSMGGYMEEPGYGPEKRHHHSGMHTGSHHDDSLSHMSSGGSDEMTTPETPEEPAATAETPTEMGKRSFESGDDSMPLPEPDMDKRARGEGNGQGQQGKRGGVGSGQQHSMTLDSHMEEPMSEEPEMKRSDEMPEDISGMADAAMGYLEEAYGAYGEEKRDAAGYGTGYAGTAGAADMPSTDTGATGYGTGYGTGHVEPNAADLPSAGTGAGYGTGYAAKRQDEDGYGDMIDGYMEDLGYGDDGYGM